MASALSNPHLCVHSGVVEGCGTRHLHQYPYRLLVNFDKGAGHGVELIVDNGGMFVKHHLILKQILLSFVPLYMSSSA